MEQEDKISVKEIKEQKESDKPEVKYLVRIANTDLNGSKPLYYSLTKIKGIGFVYANMLCNLSNISKDKKTGLLSEQEISRLNDILKNPHKFNVPAWVLNRRKDYETGADMHLIGSDIKFVQDNDVKRLKKIKSYIGIRHMQGLPVRGQRTKSNFRKNKGKGSLGVQKKKMKAGRV